jgi:hypothetical protein
VAAFYLHTQIWEGIYKPFISVYRKSFLFFALLNFATIYPDVYELHSFSGKLIVGIADGTFGLLLLFMFYRIGRIHESEQEKIHNLVGLALALAAIQALVSLAVSTHINFTTDLIIVLFLNAVFQRGEWQYWSVQLWSIVGWSSIVYFRCVLTYSLPIVSLVHWVVILVFSIVSQELVRLYLAHLVDKYTEAQKELLKRSEV